jgi:hypothetical protein
MTTRTRSVALLLVMPILTIAYVFGSETYYARSISPSGISNVRDYFNRFGDPDRIQHVYQKGQSYYEFNGHLPPLYLLAHPSSPPAYIFDEQGKFITWCKDPGDDPAYHETWQSQGAYQIEIGSVKEKFAIR